jgi:hypothetical protein
MTGRVPAGFNVGRPSTNRVLVLLRALPRGKDMAGAIELVTCPVPDRHWAHQSRRATRNRDSAGESLKPRGSLSLVVLSPLVGRALRTA